MQNRNVWIGIVLAGLPLCAQAQWLNFRAPGTPQTRDGRTNLSAPAPRAANGKPDLSGVWEAEAAPIPVLMKLLPGGQNGLGEDLPSQYFINMFSDFKPDESPLRPAAAAAYQQALAGMGKDFPVTRCLPAGVPAADLSPIPFKIIQTPGVIAMLYELDTSFRQIYTDGRKQPQDPLPSWMGYSVGKWEGDTLVVDVVGFNDKSWLDASGHTHSDELHVIERFHRRDFGHMEIQVTLEDPKILTRPVTFKFNEILQPETDLIELYCAENEKDVHHLAFK
jgi:hypothetical protein